ncbi:MAG: L,D-transpeptidase family protein [Magnetococcales bacterium]|nr:L,D-transpeptidase family protein [Magnetococcales bacterium]
MVMVLWGGVLTAWSADAPVPLADAGALFTIDPGVEGRVRDFLHRAGIGYPLDNAFALLVFKAEQRLELWVHTDTVPRLVKRYPLTAMSGQAGPKQQRGDRQIPEGIYQVIWLHPSSSYHLALKLDYPNLFDQQRAAEEGRTDLGGDIFVHGGKSSVGCVAVGDAAIEELFVLALTAAGGPAEVIIAPYDFRVLREQSPLPAAPAWLPVLYQQIEERLARYRIPVAEP